MNIKKETEKRLNYQEQKLQDLKECIENGNLSIDAKNYVYSEIMRTDKNILYYEEILKVIK